MNAINMIKRKVCILKSGPYSIGQNINPEAIKSLQGVNEIPVIECSEQNPGYGLFGTIGVVNNTEVRISKNTCYELWAEVLLTKDVDENDKFSCSFELENHMPIINKCNIKACYLHKNGYAYEDQSSINTLLKRTIYTKTVTDKRTGSG